MKRLVLMPTVVLIAGLLAACTGDVVVMVEREGRPADGDEPTMQPVTDLQVRAIPFDRDVVFDSLTHAASEPEPEIPEELAELRTAVAANQREWQESEAQWLQTRDQLRAISDRMEGMDPTGADYMALFRQFQELEIQAETLERRKDNAFETFTELQQEYFGQAEAMRLRQDLWADEAFRDVGEIFAARLDALRLEVHADTTSKNGVARFQLKPGKWWIHARYELPFHELYWNVPVEVEARERVEVRLSPENAERRPVF